MGEGQGEGLFDLRFQIEDGPSPPPSPLNTGERGYVVGVFDGPAARPTSDDQPPAVLWPQRGRDRDGGAGVAAGEGRVRRRRRRDGRGWAESGAGANRVRRPRGLSELRAQG